MGGLSPIALRASLVVSLAIALGAPGTALAHDVNTAAGHKAEDEVVHNAATRGAAQQADPATFRRRVDRRPPLHVAADPGQVGQWGPVVDWPVVGIHVALLPNGKVLAWDSVGDRATETFPVHDFTRATVYDPVTGTQTPVNVDTGYNIFCSGFAHLSDGSLFIAGGNKDAQLNGIVQTHLFNPATNTWSLGPEYGRRPLVSVGHPADERRDADHRGRPRHPGGAQDRWQPAGAEHGFAQPAALSLAGRGARRSRLLLRARIRRCASSTRRGAAPGRASASATPSTAVTAATPSIDIGKTLVAGGGPSSNDARVIDVNGATPQVSATAPMAFGRRQHNLTLLADGSVLATGGNSTGASLIDMNGGVYNAERWDPATGQWTTLAAQAVTRQYHSTALLLPDGRVLSSGGGICGTCDQVGYLAKNAEIFTPPYLFKKDGSGELAPRPEIDDGARHGQPRHVASRSQRRTPLRSRRSD